MSERMLWDDYEIRGKLYEIWAENGPDHWYIACSRCNYVIVPDCTKHFPPSGLSHAEVERIGNAVHDWFVD